MPVQCARKQHGVTLIEVLVVVCIVGVIARLPATTAMSAPAAQSGIV